MWTKMTFETHWVGHTNGSQKEEGLAAGMQKFMQMVCSHAGQSQGSDESLSLSSLLSQTMATF